MLFSIVVPVYNVEKYIDECLNSILVQLDGRENDVEILLIDDGSTDKSAEICDEYAQKYKGVIRVFHKENEGLLATRRYGFKRASGEYIVNCDSDDLLEDNMLSSVKKIVEKYNWPDIIFINHNSYDGRIKEVAKENIFTDKHDCKISKKRVLCEYLSGHSIVSVCGKVIKKTCIDFEIDYTEFGKLSTGEDTLQSVEFFSRANSFVYLNEALYDYRCGSGMTAKFDRNYYFTFKHIFEYIDAKRIAWNLEDFDVLFAIKVLQTVGRAITQSRFNSWNSVGEQKKYLKDIRNDYMVEANLKFLTKVNHKLQYDHYMLLQLFKRRLYCVTILLLRIKNVLR